MPVQSSRPPAPDNAVPLLFQSAVLIRAFASRPYSIVRISPQHPNPSYVWSCWTRFLYTRKGVLAGYTLVLAITIALTASLKISPGAPEYMNQDFILHGDQSFALVWFQYSPSVFLRMRWQRNFEILDWRARPIRLKEDPFHMPGSNGSMACLWRRKSG
jgi:hypothetical protein